MSLLFKVIYTALLLGIASGAVRELWQVWFDTRVYVGKFDIITGTGKDAEASEAFAKRIVAEQTILAQQLLDYSSRRDALSDTTYRIDGIAPLQLPPEILGGIDITVQEINVRQLLMALRRGFLAPNEVRGSVTQSEGSVIAAVEWPRAPVISGSNASITKFLVRSRGDVQAVAGYIACSISWARASGGEQSILARIATWLDQMRMSSRHDIVSGPSDSPVNVNLSTLSREQFCDFATALNKLYALEEAASTRAGLSEEQANTVRRWTAILRTHYSDKQVLPDIYRLRGDLLDLLPEGNRQPGELVEAQEDRLRYAMLSPNLRDLPDEEKRMAALALARPALLLEDGKPQDVQANWSTLLNHQLAEIGIVAAASGMVTNAQGRHLGTGFIVAPRLMMTAGFVMDAAIARPAGAEAPEEGSPQLCFGPSDNPCKTELTIGKMVYDGRSKGSNVMLLELPQHDPALIPAVSFADATIEANTVIGRYAYVIGYPTIDFRMPPDFMHHLLSQMGGRKRLMPGRILAFGTGSDRPDRKVFTSDISTSSGTGGGPLTDLQSGKVIGMSYAGQWQGEHGKFSYSEPIPAEALQMILKRSSGSLELAAPSDKAEEKTAAPAGQN
ncbi:serine protease [Rhizobium ruizarguesonis]|uniref:S1 family peptidase n=1 Tax=Rhizobium ruizarguesonis TaxID=2081791 RepID=UPI0010325FC9|nr:serine protease [Rhizobium ruizarguesonis]TAX63546.1 serine protease [Rhizobium ruizarguesonis]